MQIKKLLAEQEQPTPVFRSIDGGNVPVGTIITKRIRTDRQPMDSFPLGAAIFDYAIEQHLGVPNIRKRALFAHTDVNQITGYGNISMRIIVPSNTDVIYNPNVNDSVAMTALDEGDGDLINFLNETAKRRAQYSKMMPDHERRLMIMSADMEWYFDPRPLPEKFEELVTSWVPQQAGDRQLWINLGMECMKDMAQRIGQNYIKTTMQNLPDGGPYGYEVMIYGIPEYQGEVVPRHQ